MTREEWEASVPECIRRDALWKVKAYRLGLFLCDLAWSDVTKLAKDRRTAGIADQLFRAVGNISSNIGEGYSRGTGKARAQFYEYGLGSTREARDWYYKARHVLTDVVANHRMTTATEIIRLLIRMTATDRRDNARIETGGGSLTQ